MSERVQDTYEDDEFENMLEDARMNAANDWEEQFVSDMHANSCNTVAACTSAIPSGKPLSVSQTTNNHFRAKATLPREEKPGKVAERRT